MPQFAVYRNPGRNPDILFVVQVQSTRLERSAGRVVMPLVRRSGMAPPDHPLTPHLRVVAQNVFADPFDLATVLASLLGDVVCILPEQDQDKILHALDQLISRA